MAAALGLGAVFLVDLGLNTLVDARTLAWIQPDPSDRRLVLHAVAAPITEEFVKAGLVGAALLVLSLRRGIASPVLFGAFGLAVGFSWAETITNGDYSTAGELAATVATRIMAHASFGVLLFGGLWIGIRKRNPTPALLGFAGAILAHSAFNALGVLGFWPIRSLLFGTFLLLVVSRLSVTRAGRADRNPDAATPVAA